MSALLAISPIDGRYAAKTAALRDYFSEYALIRYRVLVEIRYLQALKQRTDLPQLAVLDMTDLLALDEILDAFDPTAAERIKAIERKTNHDVKAVEYFLKEALRERGLERIEEFVHFGLTSQDINNTAVPLSLFDGLNAVYYPLLEATILQLEALAESWSGIALLARTHGQPASPTLLGKEFRVFTSRLRQQREQLEAVPRSAKFGGATGNMNAHYVSYPGIDWHEFATAFLREDLQLERSYPTTQIEHYDNLGACFHALSRINTILIDLCRDVWTYISMEYFRQKTVAGEVGSSAMPHKVNPIDFENAEGNLGIANALFGHLAEKLPISRLQRDLTDSTVLRNIGVPIAHSVIALQAIQKGLGKLLLNEDRIAADLEANWMVVAEGIQNILRREGYPQPYEALKALTRGKHQVGQQEIHDFIRELDIDDSIKAELLRIRPDNYVGRG
jgi:adenylosuccinate lyase